MYISFKFPRIKYNIMIYGKVFEEIKRKRA